MSVNLSPVGGAGAQFCDNNGNPLNGGKLYTYSAGTTTPAATYTSAAGSVFHPNPIILNAGGRVPDSGEIWLSDNISYKFVLKTSADVLIATWDNINGINSNFVNYTIQEEVITATAGQTVFNLSTITYAPGTNSLAVYVDGVNQIVTDSYLETNANTVTFVSGLHVGALVKFTTAIPATGTATNADVVAYDPPFTGGVSTTVEAKLAQTVSVKDFGAVGDGVTDDTAAIQAGLDSCNTDGKCLFFPSGTYKITSSLVFYDYQIVRGEGWRKTIITGNLPNASIIRTQYGETPTYDQRTIGWDIAGFQVNAQDASNSIGLNFGNVGYSNVADVGVYSATTGLKCTHRTYYTCFINLTIQACFVCADLQSDGGANEFINPNFGFGGGVGNAGVKITSGSWKFNGGTVDTNSTDSGWFFKVGENGYATTASIQISNVYVEGVSSAQNLLHFYDNTITTNIYGVERRGALGPIVYENTTIYDGIYMDSAAQANPAGQFTRRVSFTRDPSTGVIDGGIKSIEGSTLAVVAQDLTSPGGISVARVNMNGNGGGSAGIYFHTATPEGAITAAAGSLCIVNTGGGTGSVGGLYKKTGGTGNTGWVAL